MPFPTAFSLQEIPWIPITAFIGLIIFFYLHRKQKSPFREPFTNDARRPRDQMEFDEKKRALRLKQTFSTSALPPEIDAIVIGSGMGGLSTAAILAKTGRKVVVLEQHYKAGGCCNSFTTDQGYEFDVGINYVGHMGPSDFERFMLDQLTEGQLDWQKMDEDMDMLILTKLNGQKVTIPMWSDRDRLRDELIKRYPQYEYSLNQFFKQISSLSSVKFLWLIKTMPIWLATLITKLHLHKIFTAFFVNYHETTVRRLLNRLFGEEEREIKAVVSYCYGLYGVEPNRAPAGVFAFAYDYFTNGAYYPVGGASEIAYSLVPTIEKAGGRVLVNANVTEILMENDKAIGVRVTTNSGQIDIKAPLIISDAGISNTFRKLLPKEVAKRTKIGKLIESRRIKPSEGFFQVYVGLKGSQNDLKLPNKNLWLIPNGVDTDKILSDWFGLDLDDALYRDKFPFIFVSFQSAKDPTYNDRNPGRSVCTIIIPTPFKWFRKWENEPVKLRASEYQAAKMNLARRCWDRVVEIYPHLADRKEYIDSGTPLSTAHFLNAFAGESYGLSHDTERFAPDVAMALRPKVPEIGNLYLTGQDVLMVGMTTCLYSAVLTSQAILKPFGECDNLLEDAKRLFNQCRIGELGSIERGKIGRSLGEMAHEE